MQNYKNEVKSHENSHFFKSTHLRFVAKVYTVVVHYRSVCFNKLTTQLDGRAEIDFFHI